MAGPQAAKRPGGRRVNAEHELLSRHYLELLSHAPEAREARLSQLRRESPALAVEIESMLRHDSDPPSILKTGGHGSPEPRALPERIGPYRVVSQLGAGGMGEVFLAEQDEPLKRRVAVKILGSGAGSPAAWMRFEIERQVLARLAHPNVARVYDAGTTESGRPWFAMEVVNGPRITSFCDQQRLPVRARLDLFLQVCAGVHHAHQKAILHRDLKPGNVTAYQRMGKFEVAAALSRELNEAAVRVYGAEHAKTFIFGWYGSYMMILLGRYDLAEAALRRALSPDSTSMDRRIIDTYHWLLGECLVGQGRRKEAVEQIDRAYFLRSSRWPGTVEESSHLLYLNASRRLLRGDRKGAIVDLRAALQVSPLPWVSVDKSPVFRELHDDPEFRKLLATERNPYLM